MNTIKQTIKRIKKSKDGRILASNFGYLMLLQIAGYVFPLITIPYLARVIGLEGFGKIAFAAAVIVWFQTIADWGFNYTATRDVAKNRGNPEKVAEIFSNVLWARVFLMFISLGVLLVAIELVPYLKENRTILLVTFLLVPGQIMFPDWFFQAMEKMKYITVFNLFSKAVFTSLVFLLIKKEHDYIIQPLLMSLGYIISGVAAMYIILVKWEVKLYAPHWISIKRTISGSAGIFINNLVPNLYNSFSAVLLGFYGGSVANGLLDAGRKFVDLGQQLINIIARVFFPFLSRYGAEKDKHKIYAWLSMGLTIFASMALIVLAPLIIKIFFTAEFVRAELVMQVMAISLVFATINIVYGTNYLIIKGQDKYLAIMTLYCSIAAFSISIPLVVCFGYMGAAVSILLGRIFLSVFILRRVRQLNHVHS